MAPERDLHQNREFLSVQYADSENFRIRVETHRKYSERKSDTFGGWLMAQLAAPEGCLLADIGCGPGNYHPPLAARSVRIVALDASPGMVREARERSLREGYRVDLMVASAEHLPFRDGTFDRVMANHMLYHVPDQPAALREMRRIARSGGRVMLTTNAPNDAAAFSKAHVAAAKASGFEPIARAGLRFTLANTELVRSVFPDAEVRVRDDALVFPDPEGPARYYSSYLVDSIADAPANGSHRPVLIDAFKREVAAVIAREGEFRVPRAAGCFIAEI